MAGLAPPIHVLVAREESKTSPRHRRAEATPFFERLCAVMTASMWIQVGLLRWRSQRGEHLLLERCLEAIELWHQRIADRGALRGRSVDRRIKTAHSRLQQHRTCDQVLQPWRKLFNAFARPGIGGRQLDL